jgi:hypothetical protein
MRKSYSDKPNIEIHDFKFSWVLMSRIELENKITALSFVLINTNHFQDEGSQGHNKKSKPFLLV